MMTAWAVRDVAARHPPAPPSPTAEVSIASLPKVPLVAAVTAVSALLGAWALAVLPGRVSSAEPADPPPVTDLRVAYLGTGHRSIGLVEGSGATATAVPLFGGGPAHFDDEASAGGDVVAWVSRRESELAQLWMRRGVGEPVRLTDDPVQVAGSPSVSPDGSRIAFELTREGVGSWRDIFVIGTDGTGLRQVTDGAGDNRRPTWSPDGSTLAFECRDDAGVPQVRRVPADGGPVTALTARPEGPGSPPGTRTRRTTGSRTRPRRSARTSGRST